MAKINLAVNFTGETQDIITVWYETSAPTAEIDRRIDSPPHTQLNFTIDGLNPVMHLVKFYRSTDGTTLQTLLLSMSVDASLINVPSVEILEFKVGSGIGGAPDSGDSQYVNADLDSTDVTAYTVDKPGFGTLSFSENINLLTGGGFEFIDGTTFYQDEVYVLTIYKMVVQQTSEVAIQAPFGDVSVLSTNIDFDSTYYNNLLIGNYSTFGIIALPALASIPNGTMLNLSMHDSVKGVGIECDGSDTIAFMGADRSAIYVMPGEEIRIYFHSGVGRVFHYQGAYKDLGKQVYGFASGINTLPLDGTEYTIAEHPRLYHDFIEDLPAGQLVTYAVWNTSQVVSIAGNSKTVYPNRGLFALSNDGLKFKVPDLRNMFVRGARYLDGTGDGERLTQAIGGLQHEQIISHSHSMTTKNGGGAGGPDWAGTTSAGTANTATTGGTETRPDNYSLIPLIIE